MSDPDDRTNEPAMPDDAHGQDAERPVADEADVQGRAPARDGDREVDDTPEDERISDPGGDSDPEPADA